MRSKFVVAAFLATLFANIANAGGFSCTFSVPVTSGAHSVVFTYLYSPRDIPGHSMLAGCLNYDDITAAMNSINGQAQIKFCARGRGASYSYGDRQTITLAFGGSSEWTEQAEIKLEALGPVSCPGRY